MSEETEEELYNRAVSQPLDFKVKRAIKLLQFYERKALEKSPDGYYLAFSGGKDSIVMKELAKMAGVKFKAHYNVTTIDPPQIVDYIRKEHADVVWEFRNPYKVGFFQMVARWGLPTGTARWCCRLFKEGGGEGQVVLVGVRTEESSRRKRMWKEYQVRKDTDFLCPICYWTDKDIWDFIRGRGIPYCSLYDQGFNRVGCIGCPLQSIHKLNEQFRKFPKWEHAYKLAAYKYFENREKRIKEGTYRGNLERVEKTRTKEEYWEYWRFQMGRKDFKLCVFEEMRREFPT